MNNDGYEEYESNLLSGLEQRVAVLEGLLTEVYQTARAADAEYIQTNEFAHWFLVALVDNIEREVGGLEDGPTEWQDPGVIPF